MQEEFSSHLSLFQAKNQYFNIFCNFLFLFKFWIKSSFFSYFFSCFGLKAHQNFFASLFKNFWHESKIIFSANKIHYFLYLMDFRAYHTSFTLAIQFFLFQVQRLLILSILDRVTKQQLNDFTCFFDKKSRYMKKNCFKYSAWHKKHGHFFTFVYYKNNLVYVHTNNRWVDYGVTTIGVQTL